ncbi:MAG: DUF2786 domain-containing protein [Telmatospirillum sp.]|nr:DUF2786 domain-containing protein [Telmatospirillum sp.]
MSTHFEKLIARLTALRAKTVANGCTEEEALAAAAKVAELMDRHDLTAADLGTAGQSCGRIVIIPDRKLRRPIDACVGAIATFCDCRVWLEKAPDGTSGYVFFGCPAGLTAAGVVTDVVASVLRTAWGDYKRRGSVIRYNKDERGSFLLGVAVSLGDRLLEMKAGRIGVPGGRDLVLSRRSVVDVEFARLGLTLETGGPSGKAILAKAFDAGQSAGRDLSFGLSPDGRLSGPAGKDRH